MYIQDMRMVVAFLMMLAAFCSIGESLIVIETERGMDAHQAYPFHTTTWGGSYFMVYRNLSAFTLRPFDTIAFDITKVAPVPINRTIKMASINLDTMIEKEEYRVVVNEKAPLSIIGNNVVGDFESIYIIEQEYAFSGGGLVIQIDLPINSDPVYQASPGLSVSDKHVGSISHSRHFTPLGGRYERLIDTSTHSNVSIPSFKLFIANPTANCNSTHFDSNQVGCINGNTIFASNALLVDGTFIQTSQGTLVFELNETNSANGNITIHGTHCFEIDGNLVLNLTEVLYKEIVNGDDNVEVQLFESDLSCVYGEFSDIQVLRDGKDVKCVKVNIDNDHKTMNAIFISNCDAYVVPLAVTISAVLVLSVLIAIYIKIVLPRCRGKKHKEYILNLARDVDVEDIEDTDITAK